MFWILKYLNLRFISLFVFFLIQDLIEISFDYLPKFKNYNIFRYLLLIFVLIDFDKIFNVYN